ncbi:MAG: TetR family transcriptional regulator [Oleispira antarctica]|uniref:Transcriptional regulator, TetR family n=1 Tax=Oleispira antarctica RB-8 TaxID=698738 RepID=R4YL52_OLEAN|nr:TetR family transcriptional regulator [Oleispira antarctica]MBQ0791975.1 TetR family transcriptional regulator [Oleispira antarctica]CCK75160.1 Transcriptional regulator, TetR family [Oleispira antarctica RB-8]|tara:strand:- start:4240 stop:4956 length:717 start_codon:yes stop_codon:yes gene_type:complete
MSQLSDSLSNSKSGSAVKYQGRKTSRAGSELRRRLILEASLRIVIREGVRGIRHRAVAKEADVPLAATTYYFKDIQELINDTFTLYAEQSLEIVTQFSRRLYEPLENSDGKTFVEAMNSAEDMSGIIADSMTQYVVEQITQHRDALIAEQAFRYEAILSPHLRKLGEVHKLALIQKLTELLSLMQSPQPVEDATIVISILHRIEYEGLLVEPENLDIKAIRATLLRQLSLMFNDQSRA